MSNYQNRDNNNSGGGSNRRRRPRRDNDRPDRGERTGGNETVPRPSRREEPSFMQKILGFFGLGKSKSNARPQKPTSGRAPTTRTTDARTPREPKPRREHTAPNPADVTTDRLYVGNLSYDAAESDLMELFNGVGTVRNAEVVVNSRTQRSKGFAFVTMGSLEEARRAVVELSNKDFMGRPLQLSGAKPNVRGDRDFDNEGGGQGQREEAAAA